MTSDKARRSSRGKAGAKPARPKASPAVSARRPSPGPSRRVSLDEAFTPRPRVPVKAARKPPRRAPAQAGTGLLWGIAVGLAMVNAALIVVLIVRS